MRLTYEKHEFYRPLKSLMLTYYNLCIKIVFSRNVRSGKRMFYKTPVLHTLFDARKTGVKEHTLTCVTRFTCLPCIKRTFNNIYRQVFIISHTHS